jgi:DnaK suppressor protein
MQPHPDLTEELLEEFAAMLRDDIARLDRHLAQLEANGTVELDQSVVGRLSRMDALMNQGLGQATDRRAVTDRQDAIDALGRIKDGSYGICLACHEPIPIARLEAMPEARNCTRCG